MVLFPRFLSFISGTFLCVGAFLDIVNLRHCVRRSRVAACACLLIGQLGHSVLGTPSLWAICVVLTWKSEDPVLLCRDVNRFKVKNRLESHFQKPSDSQKHVYSEVYILKIPYKGRLKGLFAYS